MTDSIITRAAQVEGGRSSVPKWFPPLINALAVALALVALFAAVLFVPANQWPH